MDRTMPSYGNEKEYFERIYSDKVTLVDPVFKTRNVYSEMAKADIIISFGSTAVLEAFGMGKKVLYCDFSNTDLYNDYDPMILFKEEDYALFKERLDKLRVQSEQDYKAETNEYRTYVMNNDPDRPPHMLIRQVINDFLNANT